jgi:hypothetical protein
MDEAKRELVHNWLLKASHDLAAARLLAQGNQPILDVAHPERIDNPSFRRETKPASTDSRQPMPRRFIHGHCERDTHKTDRR